MKELPIQEFYLNRKEDVSGVSGTGIVARGVILPSGRCVMEWQNVHSSLTIFNNLQEVTLLHGHAGKSEVVLVKSKGKKTK